jgi:hypothetical protein
MGNITNPIDTSIKEGTSIIRDAQGNLTAIVRDTVAGTVSVFQNGINGLTLSYVDTERNFFSIANNLVQNLANVGTIVSSGVVRDVRGFEKDVITLLDDVQDNVNEDVRLVIFQIANTIQYIIALGFLGFLLIAILYGEEILQFVKHIIDKGVHLSF